MDTFETKTTILKKTCLGGGGDDEGEREGGDVHTSVSFSFSPEKKYIMYTYNLIYCNIECTLMTPSLFLLQTEQGFDHHDHHFYCDHDSDIHQDIPDICQLWCLAKIGQNFAFSILKSTRLEKITPPLVSD